MDTNGYGYAPAYARYISHYHVVTRERERELCPLTYVSEKIRPAQMPQQLINRINSQTKRNGINRTEPNQRNKKNASPGKTGSGMERV